MTVEEVQQILSSNSPKAWAPYNSGELKAFTLRDTEMYRWIEICYWKKDISWDRRYKQDTWSVGSLRIADDRPIEGCGATLEEALMNYLANKLTGNDVA